MKYSIITVCKNAENQIERTLQSVLNQKYVSIEYIIIDGLSTDKTLSIIEKYKDEIAILISESDTGIYNAMNKGVHLASGDVIHFLNAGDVYISEFSLRTIQNNLFNYSLFFTDFIAVNPQKEEVIFRNSALTDKYDLHNKYMCQQATFYRKECFDKVGFFDENYSIVSDRKWYLEALLKHKIKFDCLPITTVIFYLDGISSSEKYEILLNEETNELTKKYFTTTEQRLFKVSLFKIFLQIKILRKIIRKIMRWNLK